MKQIKRLPVHINQEDIDSGLPLNSHECMIAHALKRENPKLKRISVDHAQVRATDSEKNTIYTFDMPPLGKVALLKFDNGEPVTPFEITLKQPIVRTRKIRKDLGEKHGRKWRAVTADDRQKGADTAARSHGPVVQAKTKEARLRRGRDRVFGAKVHAKELKSIRLSLGVVPA